MSMASFEEIAIVDLDLAKTTWSRVHSSMRTLYLRLTREPETAWVRFFHEERESRIVLKRHGLWIEDGYIVFDCLLEDVEEYHLPDFRLSVAYANEKYRELLEARREQGEQQRDVARAEEQELAALRARIRGGTPVAVPLQPMQVPRTAIGSPVAAAAAPLVTATVSWMPAARPANAATAPAWLVASKAAREKLAFTPALAQEIATSGPVAAAAPEPKQSISVAPRMTPTPVDVGPSALPQQAPQAQAVVAPSVQPAGAATSAAQSPSAAASQPEAALADIAGFNAKREEWRARFRAALASRPKEPARGND